MLTVLITEIIHRTEEYHTNLFHGWSGYRLGDCVIRFHNIKPKNTIDYHKKNFPNSIATQYMNKTKKREDYDVLYKIVKTYKNTTPKDIIIIHLRLGDVHEDNSTKRYNNYYYNLIRVVYLS